MKAEQLRKSILQLAIQGKLVPQDSNDEPASVLLERIRAEKQRLIKQGKIKKDKFDSIIFKGDDNCYYEKMGNELKDISEEVADFDIPNSWVFARIETLVSIQTGASFKKELATDNKGFIRVLRGGNIKQNGYSLLDNDLFIPSELVSENILLKTNDLITPAVTSIENIGKIARIDQDYNDVTAGGFVFIIRPILNNNILAKYFLYAFQSSSMIASMKSITKKSGQAFYNLGKERLIKLIMPIPPLAEQERIVGEIERYEPLIAEYGKLEQQSTKLNDEIKDKLKKSILQYAVQGKLVEQNPSDEPASVLLERIREEKRKQLGKKYVDSYIYKGDDNRYYEHANGKDIDITEDIPFDLPENWCWTKIGDIAFVTKLAGFEYSKYIAPNLQAEGIPLFKGKNVQNSNIIYKFEGYIPESVSDELIRSQVSRKCILTPYVGTIGNIGIHNREGKYHLGSNVGKIELNDYRITFEEYVVFYLKSTYGYTELTKFKKATAQESISIEAIREVYIPLPPLTEQERIVSKINQIFSLL